MKNTNHYEVIRKHSDDTNTSLVGTFDTRAEAAAFVKNEVDFYTSMHRCTVDKSVNAWFISLGTYHIIYRIVKVSRVVPHTV